MCCMDTHRPAPKATVNVTALAVLRVSFNLESMLALLHSSLISQLHSIEDYYYRADCLLQVTLKVRVHHPTWFKVITLLFEMRMY